MIPPDLTDPEVLIGQRAFLDAQRLLAVGEFVPVGAYTVGWHDTVVQPYRGCFAVVSESVPEMADLVGDVLRVTARDLEVVVYVLGRADVTQPISLARRAFMALSGLWREDVTAVVWRVRT